VLSASILGRIFGTRRRPGRSVILREPLTDFAWLWISIGAILLFSSALASADQSGDPLFRFAVDVFPALCRLRIGRIRDWADAFYRVVSTLVASPAPFAILWYGATIPPVRYERPVGISDRNNSARRRKRRIEAAAMGGASSGLSRAVPTRHREPRILRLATGAYSGRAYSGLLETRG